MLSQHVYKCSLRPLVLLLSLQIVLAHVISDPNQAGFIPESVETVIRTESSVYHIYVHSSDTDDLLVYFSDGNALKVYNESISLTYVIAGSVSRIGYREGKGQEARFNRISSFALLDDIIVLADSFNFCLRKVRLDDSSTGQFVGKCTSSGNKDGKNALFGRIYSLAHDGSKGVLYLTDYDSSSLRLFDLVNRTVQTIHKYLKNPTGLYLDSRREIITVLSWSDITELNLTNLSVTRVAGCNMSVEGEFTDAEQRCFKQLQDVTRVENGDLIVTELVSPSITVLNGEGEVIQPKCDNPGFNEGGMCLLQNPISVTQKNNTVYIGQVGVIRRIQYVGDKDVQTELKCPERNIVRQFSSRISQQEAYLDLPSICGERQRLSLSVGRYNYQILANNQSCDTNISIIDSRLRKRLILEAHYEVSCKLMSRNDVGIVRNTLTRYVRDLNELKVFTVKAPQVICSNSTLSSNWPTDVTYPGYISTVPSDVVKNIEKTPIKPKSLGVVFKQRIPPLVYPVVSELGRFLRLSLRPFCLDNYVYEPEKERCFPETVEHR